MPMYVYCLRGGVQMNYQAEMLEAMVQAGKDKEPFEKEIILADSFKESLAAMNLSDDELVDLAAMLQDIARGKIEGKPIYIDDLDDIDDIILIDEAEGEEN